MRRQVATDDFESRPSAELRAGMRNLDGVTQALAEAFYPAMLGPRTGFPPRTKLVMSH